MQVIDSRCIQQSLFLLGTVHVPVEPEATVNILLANVVVLYGEGQWHWEPPQFCAAAKGKTQSSGRQMPFLTSLQEKTS